MAINLGSTAISNIKLGSTQVDKVYLGSTEVWSNQPTPIIKALKFTSPNSQALGIDNSKLGTVSPSLEYSTDNGATWSNWDVTTTLSFGSGVTLYLRGMNTVIAKSGTNYTNFTFSTASPVYCEGNIMHLYDYTQDLTSFPIDPDTRGLKCLFANCIQLVTCPSLPATGLVNNVYYHMFENCSSLVTLPFLPAQTGKSGGYDSMFKGCSLIKLSETQVGEYQNVYNLAAFNFAFLMFSNTGGTFTGTPDRNTYYTSNTIII